MTEHMRRLMQEAEYHIACADEDELDRLQALDALSDWLSDLRTFVRTGVPMADSDRFRICEPVA